MKFKHGQRLDTWDTLEELGPGDRITIDGKPATVFDIEEGDEIYIVYVLDSKKTKKELSMFDALLPSETEEDEGYDDDDDFEASHGGCGVGGVDKENTSPAKNNTTTNNSGGDSNSANTSDAATKKLVCSEDTPVVLASPTAQMQVQQQKKKRVLTAAEQAEHEAAFGVKSPREEDSPVLMRASNPTNPSKNGNGVTTTSKILSE